MRRTMGSHSAAGGRLSSAHGSTAYRGRSRHIRIRPRHSLELRHGGRFGTQSPAFRSDLRGVNWHNARNPRPESVRRYKAVPRDGGNRFQMQRNLDHAGLGHLVPACWRNKPTGTTDVFGRLWWDRPAYTLRTEFYKPEKGRYLHPSAHRPITVREAARCMSFDDDFVLPVDQSMTSIARQVGNAVPPLLARRIAEVVAAHILAEGATDGRPLTAAA